MNAYVQSKTKGQLNKHIANLGLNEVGCYVKVLEDHVVSPLEIEEAVYYGNVGWIKDVIRRLGYEHNQMGDVPRSLLPFAGRNITRMRLKDVRGIVKRGQFIKPVVTEQKAFNAVSIRSDSHFMIETANYPDDGMVLVSDPLDIVSEWRCFILDDSILAAEHYKGDFRVHPDYKMVDVMVNAYKKESPAAYALDVVITKDGKTLVMETNDVMCLGWYGLLPIKAGRMLVKRWEQIHQNKHT